MSLFKHLCFWVFLTHIWTSHCISDNLKAVHFHNSIDICAHLCCTSSISLPLRMLGSQPYPIRILDMWGIILLLRMDLGREMSTGIYLCLSISLFFLPLLTYNSRLASLCATQIYQRIKAHISSLVLEVLGRRCLEEKVPTHTKF